MIYFPTISNIISHLYVDIYRNKPTFTHTIIQKHFTFYQIRVFFFYCRSLFILAKKQKQKQKPYPQPNRLHAYHTAVSILPHSEKLSDRYQKVKRDNAFYWLGLEDNHGCVHLSGPNALRVPCRYNFWISLFWNQATEKVG